MKVYLVGVGMGNAGTLTREAERIIRESDALIGSKRLLEQFEEVASEMLELVRAADIKAAIEAGGYETVSVLLSGDVGFYSGAAPLYRALEACEVRAVPGVSSIAYFCAKVRTPWHDAAMASVHGRSCDAAAIVRASGKAFFITGGAMKVSDVCAQLVEAGMGALRAAAGERLSYDDERIVCGTVEEIAGECFGDLAVLLVWREPQTSRPAGDAARILVSSAASGGGKTTFVCGLVGALSKRGFNVAACKCGPDYIDPMFHESVLGVPSRNLDVFFSGEEGVRALLADSCSQSDVTVVEGAMGYYDGVALSDEASAWHVAMATDTPVLLLVDGRSRALSVAAEVAGFARFRAKSMVAGVVLNRVSAALYPRLKKAIEAETGVPVLGYLPVLEDCSLESRHLGLVTAAEVEGLAEKLEKLAAAVELTVDIDAVLRIATSAEGLAVANPALSGASLPLSRSVRIAIARDEAFCFYYDDALRMLERMGAEFVEFSPLHDGMLPAGITGLYLGGGYPELHARELASNESMRNAIAAAIEGGMPCIAECGGFMYLHEKLQGSDGAFYPQVGAVKGSAFETDRLGRFGYVELTAERDGLLARKGDILRAHEFHYWESDDPGAAFTARKPQSDRSWSCCLSTPTLHAGFSHLYLPSNPDAARRFVDACAEYGKSIEKASR